THNGLYQLVRVIGVLGGVEHVDLHPYTFRHAFAFSWLVNGGDVFKLSCVLGHTDIQTTRLYLRAFQSQDACAEHMQFSPVETLRLGRQATKMPLEGKNTQ